MNSRPNLNLVHEAEAQRQHARIKTPAVVIVNYSKSESKTYRLIDLSAGGFCIQSNGSDLIIGDIYSGQIIFNIDGFKFVLDVKFQVKRKDQSNKQVGFEFQDLDQKQTAALRYLITSFLSGEIASTGDMLNILSRDNFTKARNSSERKSGFGFFGQVKAVTLSVLVFLVGLLAAGYVGMQLYNIFFLTTSETALLSAASHAVEMPRSGEFNSLVEPGQEVTKGQPLATFRSPLFEYLDNSLSSAMTLEQIKALSSTSTSGTLTSPCDCVVTELPVGAEQYISKGTKVIGLAEQTQEPFVLAFFEFSDAENMKPGDRVNVSVMGESRKIPGTIEAINVAPEESANFGMLQVSVHLNQPLPASYIGRPLRVTKPRLHYVNLLNNDITEL